MPGRVMECGLCRSVICEVFYIFEARMGFTDPSIASGENERGCPLCMSERIYLGT